MSDEITPVEGDPAVPVEAPIVEPVPEAAPAEDVAAEVPAADPPAADPVSLAPADDPTGAIAAEPAVDPNPPVADSAPAEVVPAGGGVLEVVARKPDASHGALHQLLLGGEKITHELLDEIEKRCDVGDVKFLVAFCRHLLDNEGA